MRWGGLLGQGSPLLLGPLTRVSVRLPVCPFSTPPHPQWLRPSTLLTVSDVYTVK